MGQRSGAVLVLASAAGFGMMPVFGKLAFQAGVSVATLLAVRFALAASLLWGLAAARGALPRVRRGVLARALLLGAVGYAMQAGLYFLALERMDAGVLSLILYTYPALVTGAAILLRREPASRRRLAALVIASAGLVLVLVGTGAGAIDALGAALGAGAALTYTAYILVSHGVTAELEPLPLAALITTGAAVNKTGTALLAGALGAGLAGALSRWDAASGGRWLGLAAVVSPVLAVLQCLNGLRCVASCPAAILST